jgi:hypothetical protein
VVRYNGNDGSRMDIICHRRFATFSGTNRCDVARIDDDGFIQLSLARRAMASFIYAAGVRITTCCIN